MNIEQIYTDDSQLQEFQKLLNQIQEKINEHKLQIKDCNVSLNHGHVYSAYRGNSRVTFSEYKDIQINISVRIYP